MHSRGDKLYLKLYHGRKTIDESVEEVGSDGPKFGPLERVHSAYISQLQLTYPDGAMLELPIVDDVILWDGVYYGDFALFTEAW